MTAGQRKWLYIGIAALAIGVLAALGWQRYASLQKDDGLAHGNGRLEAVEIDIASRTPGRLKEIKVREGDFVVVGQVLALMDTAVLEADRRQAEAQLDRAHSAVATAQSQIAQRQSDKAAAQAALVQRDVDLNAAKAHLVRAAALAEKGFISPQAVDDEKSRVDSAQAAVVAARAQVAAAESAIVSARTQAAGAESAATVARASIERIQVDIDDATLAAPRAGRVQYLVAREGEVIAAGGRVLDLVDLSDVYMTFFLPTAVAGRLALGTEARIVLDAAPDYVIPATVSFVSDVAQFTPKTVETASEREELMFRIRARISPELLQRHIMKVKTGLPGVAYVRLDANARWPDRLQVKLPP